MSEFPECGAEPDQDWKGSEPNTTVLAPLVLLLLPTAGSATVEIEWVFVGDAGNDCDPQSQRCFGAVSYDYRIGKFEVTNAQYAEFLNAVDPTGANTLGLYNSFMESAPLGGISDDGPGEGSLYQARLGFEENPVSYVTWYDALRFANWLHNGQGGSGTTESGSYTLLGGTEIPSNGVFVARDDEAATVVLPSEDEWYKAAYYDPMSSTYFDYPTGTDTPPTCELPPGGDNSANCTGAVGAHTAVGAYSNSGSLYGTFDQGGNVQEWNEEDILGNGSMRGVRGGTWGSRPVSSISASARSNEIPTSEGGGKGFRVATLPEPDAPLLAVTALLVVTGLHRIGSRKNGGMRVGISLASRKNSAHPVRSAVRW